MIRHRLKKVLLYSLFISCVLLSMVYYGNDSNPRMQIAGMISAFGFYMMATNKPKEG